jgi:phage terminase large subunit-like protein
VSERLAPERWASRAVQLYHELKADRIIAERNYGGDMVESVIRTVDHTVPVRLVNASRGKRLRAEPVSALDEQGKIHIVGSLPLLEDQLCNWVPDAGDPSPDRLDAMVWAMTELMLGGQEVKFF